LRWKLGCLQGCLEGGGRRGDEKMRRGEGETMSEEREIEGGTEEE